MLGSIVGYPMYGNDCLVASTFLSVYTSAYSASQLVGTSGDCCAGDASAIPILPEYLSSLNPGISIFISTIVTPIYTLIPKTQSLIPKP